MLNVHLVAQNSQHAAQSCVNASERGHYYAENLKQTYQIES